MKKITLILFCLSMFHLKVGAQNQQRVWYMNGQSIDFSVANPQFSPLSGGGGPNQTFNGVHDINGNAIFYTDNSTIYNGSGVAIGGFSATATAEIAIVPVPGSCSKYYVISHSSPPFGAINWEYAIVDMSVNSGAGGVISSGNSLGAGVSYTGSGIAVGKLKANGTRFLYVVEGKYLTTDVLKFTISSSGISSPTALLSIPLSIDRIAELDLSNVEDKLAFGSGSAVNIIHLDANGDINTTLGVNGHTKLPVLGLTSSTDVTGVEFSNNDNNLFVGVAGVGLYFFDLINGSVANLSSVYSYSQSQLESVYTNGQYRIYAAGWNDLAEISNINSASPTIIHNKISGLNSALNPFNSIGQLPDQVDGMDYINASTMPTINILAGPSTNISIGETVTLSVQSSLGNISNALWSNGATGSSITVMPCANTNYCVTIGCVTECITIDVEPKFKNVEDEYVGCGGVYPTICPTGATANQEWAYNTGFTSVIVHTGTCYAPTQAGEYIIISNNACYSTTTFEVIEDCPEPEPKSCMFFDGVDDYLISQTIALNDIDYDNFTIGAIVNGIEANQGSNPVILSNGSISLFLQDDPTGGGTRELSLQIGGINYSFFENGSFNTTVLDGQCHHVAVSRESDDLFFYIDGYLIGTESISGSPSVLGGPLNIGRHSSNTDFFEGIISEVGIWNNFMDENEILQELVIDQSWANATAYFKLDDGSGHIARDEIDGFHAQLGSIANNDDVNDPTWSKDCCNEEGLLRLKNEHSHSLESDQFSSNNPLLENDILIYPNPNNGIFEVSFSGEDEEATIQIYNSIGKLVESKEVSNTQQSIFNLSQHKKGVYIIKVVTTKQIKSKRVIIK